MSIGMRNWAVWLQACVAVGLVGVSTVPAPSPSAQSRSDCDFLGASEGIEHGTPCDETTSRRNAASPLENRRGPGGTPEGPTESPAREDAERQPHGAILIDGDADLCNDEDGDGVIGQDDGIINCGTASGNATHPYVIAGWRIAVGPDPLCVGGGPLPPCAKPVTCPQAMVSAALSICNLHKHLMVRDLEIRNTLVQEGNGSQTNEGSAALAAQNVSNLTVEDVDVRVGGLAVYVTKGGGASNGKAPGPPVRLGSVRIAPLSTTGYGTEAALAATTPLVEVRDADVHVARARIDATGRRYAILVDAQRDQATGLTHTFRVEDSVIENATFFGVHVQQSAAEFYRNVFTGNGAPATEVPTGPDPVSVNGAAVYLASLAYIVESNTFAANSVSLLIETNATGQIENNRFVQGRPGAVAVKLSTNFGCNVRENYNDFNAFRSVNEELICFVDGRFNWWGSNEGPSQGVLPQADGRLLFTPWLRLPLSELPNLTIVQPPDGSEVHGKVALRGTASAPNGTSPQRVEISSRRGEWDNGTVAEGGANWSYTWDASFAPLGPITLWIRACTQTDCGRPVSLHVVVVEAPLPPVAVLKVTPSVARTGEAIVLDASLSYSPQGRALVAYRFDFGNGTVTNWISSASTNASYDREGVYVVSVDAKDALGLENTNRPKVTLRIRSGDGSAQGIGGPFGATPLPWFQSFVATLGGAAWARRRREGMA